jgi:hypothetical protein
MNPSPNPHPKPIRVLSVIPPMTQLNTPYPSTAYLTGFLRSRGVFAVQEDLALQLVLRLFTAQGLEDVKARALKLPDAERSASVNFFLDFFQRYAHTIEHYRAWIFARRPALCCARCLRRQRIG